ncbi:hypothetical protein [Roseiconus lacunae]|uniref:hypothetical protein n=1 Tax=Roseiconus lacunae TaxID=2605694 RepID=UPI0011F21DEE|nr:hypothetical protein [Roseiconus lacunae]
MQQRFELFDGPFDGLHIVSDLPPSKQLRSLAIEFYDEDDEDCYQNAPMQTKSAKYDLTDTDESSDPIVHRLHHNMTLPVKCPVSTDLWSKCAWSMTTGDRHRWNTWRYEIFAAAETCRDVAKQFGDNELNETIDEFETLVLQIPNMDPVDR